MTAADQCGVYVHVPWCRVRCPYCAFTITEVGEPGPPDPTGYTDRVLRQWEAVAAHFDGPPHTVAFGGGTPSLHPVSELARMVRAFDARRGAEISLEANPEDVTPAWLEAVRRAGVTRLSLGVQTLQPGPAPLLARAHTWRQARETLAAVAAAGFESWSVDLIFAAPRQTLEELDRDLDAVGESGAPHVSLYGLTAEEGTPYTRAVARGRLRPPSPEAWREAYDHARERLASLGLHQYEVSNHARPGHRSRHNQLYWRPAAWAGLGVAAHGRLPEGTRTVGPRDLDAFMADPLAWQEWDRGTTLERGEELLIRALRHVDGLPLARVRALGLDLPDEALAPLIDEKLAVVEGGRLALSPSGLPLADALVLSLALALVDCAQPAGGEHPA